MNSRKLFVVPILGAILLLAGNVLAVAAYEGQVPAQIILSATCSGGDVAAVVKDAGGNAIANQNVDFSFVQKADDADALNPPPSATTDANGRAVVGVSLADVPGTRILKAQVGELSATTTLECREGLPPTTTAPDEATGTPVTVLIALLVAIAGVAALGTLMLRRRFVRL